MRCIGILVVGGLLMAACGSDEPAAAPAPISTTSSPPPVVTTVGPTTAPPTTIVTTTTVAPSTTAAKTDAEIEAEIIHAYLAGWDDYLSLIADPEADPGFVEETNQGAALELALEARRKRLEDGSRTEFPDNSVREHRTEFLGFEDESALVQDCYTSDSHRVSSDGQLSNVGVGTGLWVARLEIHEGRWVTTFIDRLKEWEGSVPLCGK